MKEREERKIQFLEWIYHCSLELICTGIYPSSICQDPTDYHISLACHWLTQARPSYASTLLLQELLIFLHQKNVQRKRCKQLQRHSSCICQQFPNFSTPRMDFLDQIYGSLPRTLEIVERIETIFFAGHCLRSTESPYPAQQLIFCMRQVCMKSRCHYDLYQNDGKTSSN